MPKPWFRKADPDALVVRAGSPVKRDVYKAATAGFTGVTAFGALAVTGVVAGTAAHDKALQDAAKAATPPAAPVTTPQAAAKRRPHRTVVRTRVVHAASTAVTRPATGGTVTSHTTSATSHTSTSTVTHHSAPAPAPAPAPKPKPAPAPAPSSGS